MRGIKVLILAILIITAGCSSKGKEITYFPRGDIQRTGVYDTESVTELTGVKWEYELKELSGTSGKVATANGIVYAAGVSGNADNEIIVYALNSETGEKIWEYKNSGEGIVDEPLVYNGTVYVTTLDGLIYALDGKSGKELWIEDTEGLIWRILIHEGTIYYTDGGLLTALDLKSKEQKWQTFTGGFIWASPVISEDNIYLMSGNYIKAYDLKKGTELWEHQTEVKVASLAVYDGTVYGVTSDLIRSKNGFVYALDSKTGDEIWASKLNHQFSSSPIVTEDAVYVANWQYEDPKAVTHIYALDRITGKEKWLIDLSDEGLGHPMMVGQTIYVSTNENLYAIDSQNGQELWKQKINGLAVYPTSAERTVYLITNHETSSDMKIMAIH